MKKFVIFLICITLLELINFLDVFVFRKNHYKIKEIQELTSQYESTSSEESYNQAIDQINQITISEDDSLYKDFTELNNKLKSLRERKDAERKAELEQEQKDKLESDLKKIEEKILEINSGIDLQYYDRADLQKLQEELNFFADNYKFISEYEESTNAKIKEKITLFKNKVVQLQIKEFPILRVSLGKIFNTQLWSDNIKVLTYGDGSRNIRYIGGAFSNNSNIALAYNNSLQLFERFRFKRADFLPYEEVDEYTFMTIEKIKNDSEPIEKSEDYVQFR